MLVQNRPNIVTRFGLLLLNVAHLVYFFSISFAADVVLLNGSKTATGFVFQ